MAQPRTCARRGTGIAGGLWAAVALLAVFLLPAQARIAATTVAPPGHALFRSYGPLQGLGATSVRQLLQDRQGFIWVATSDGLYRYDGHRFDGFGAAQGLLPTAVDALVEDSAGTLWAGTQAGLLWLEGEHFVAASLAGAAGDVAVSDLAATSAGIAAATNQGLYIGSQDGVRPVRSWPGGQATAVAASRDGSGLFVGQWTGTATLWRWHGDTWRQLALPAAEADERIDAIVEDGTGRWWLRTAHALLRLDAAQEQVETVATPVPIRSTRGYLHADREGGLWLSSDSELLHWDGGQWQVLQSPTSTTRPLLEDRDGSLWVGAVGLHRRLGRGVFHAYTSERELPGEVVWCVFRDHRGQLWIGTENGLARAGETAFTRVEGTAGTTVRSIAESADGTLYFAGLPGNDIVTYRPDTGALARFPLDRTNPAKRTLRLQISRDGTLWAGTWGNGLYRAALGSGSLAFEPVALPGGNATEFVSGIHEDAQGRLWVAGQYGLAVLDKGKWQRFGRAHGLRRDFVAYVESTRDGALLVAYFEPFGVARARYSEGRLEVQRHYDRASTNTADRVYAMTEDAAGNLWLGSGRGVDRVGSDGAVHFGAADGMVGEDIVSMAMLAEPGGDVWMGTTTGLVRFDAAAYERRSQSSPPDVVIMETRLGAEVVPAGSQSTMRFPHTANTLQVRYTANSFTNEGRIAYRERLVGLDEGYTITTEPHARYTALLPGQYRFEVAARAGDLGPWSAPATISFEIIPAWYRRWWAWTAYGAGLALLAWGILRWRLRRLRRMTAVLERRVSERTQALATALGELETAKEKAEVAARAKSDFLATMSHEVRTPLNAILGSAQLGMSGGAPPEVAAHLGRITLAGRHLLDVLNGILDYSRLESGVIVVESIPFDLYALLDELRAVFQVEAERKRLEWRVEIAADVPAWLRGDPLRLRQVLANLVSNALRFTDRGYVRVVVSRVGDQARPEHCHLRLRVEDSGIGIALSERERLFQPFVQVDSSTSRRVGGTGLGLSICQRLVAQMGGMIHVHSMPGAGSVFEVQVTLALSPQPALSEPVRRAPPLPVPSTGDELRDRRVLVVEDNPLNQAVIAQMLQQRQATPYLASTQAEALAIAASTQLDVVLLDIELPDADGFCVAAAFRARFPQLPLVACTAHATDDYKARCRQAGFCDFLPKPIDPETLVQVVARVRDDCPRHDAAAASPDSQEAIPGVDMTLALRRLGQDGALLRRLLRRFPEEVGSASAAIRAAIAEGDYATALKRAHGVKGVAGNLSALRLVDACVALEHALAASERETIAAAQEEFEAALAQILAHVTV
ncbi:hybrid sensor histidine kinase/response regulator [Tahibacter amnicola]|uniref:histidine kinase n=1 Tax=Tahibacter amnicola TaxID=2976241 RepID=A0ABY6BAG5_9GAMM|nr:hybrid sensor histidine kinase/response regulator [Tahibacter amnicola]UXI67053.1 ATP-binding protein [Tahibacter amnicola]